MCGDDCLDPRGVPLEGRYANFFRVGHNSDEILIDFGQFFPRGEEVQFHSRIITNRVHASALLALLQQSIDQQEGAFGDGDEES